MKVDVLDPEVSWDGEPVAPEASRLVLIERDRCAARLSYELAGELGIIGHYSASEAEAGIALLGHAVEWLRERGAARVIGPMNGSTWRQYRLAVREPGAEPPFLTEPSNPPDYPHHFEAAGFTVASEYESRIVERLPVQRPNARLLAERIERAGVRVSRLDLSRWKDELLALFPLCTAAFAANPHYRPISAEQVLELYAPMVPHLDPDLVRIAGFAGQAVGFVLALPDALSSTPRVILKTLATAPEVRRLGLGAHLADEIHRIAYEKGYGSVIHALMHASNESTRLSTRYGSRLFRGYVLYERPCR